MIISKSEEKILSSATQYYNVPVISETTEQKQRSTRLSLVVFREQIQVKRLGTLKWMFRR